MKKRLSIFLFVAIICINMLTVIESEVKALPDETAKISTVGGNIDNVSCENYTMICKKIYVEGKIGYCLDINKNYPNGQQFQEVDYEDNLVKAIICAGFPNKSPKELGVSSEEVAYCATQIAIWCYTEQLDINQIACNNKELISAIKGIYYEGTNNQNNLLEANNDIFKSYFYDSGTKTIITFYDGNSLDPSILRSGYEYLENADSNTNLNNDITSAILPKTGGISNKYIIAIAALFTISGSVILLTKQ